MRYYFDTEFIERKDTVELVSMGIIAEDGRELYFEIDSINWEDPTINPWLHENVKPYLWSQQDESLFGDWRNAGAVGGLVSREEARQLVDEFTDYTKYGAPEFWAWFATYDWYCMCQLMGGFLEVPYPWPNYCNDIKQEHVRLGHPPLPQQSGTKHHAMADARWNKEALEHLNKG